MELAKIMQLTIPQSKRIICISDIHGQLDVFKRLLDKVEFCDNDILILVGDLCAGRCDNSQSRQTLEFAMTLCERSNVYAVRGNWDLVGRLPDDIGETVKAQAAEWFNSLPHIIETQEFIFVHAGLSSNNLNEQEAQRCMRESADDVVFEKYVVVGHTPTLNYSRKILSCNPVFNMERRIISIDGGLDTWGCGQLNALIIHNSTFSYQSADNLPVYHSEKAQSTSGGELSIVWVKDKEVELIEAGEEFSIYKHSKSGKIIELANISINTDENGGLWCALDTDYYLPIDVGDKITVLHTFKDRIYAKKDGIIGYYKMNEKMGI
jgi:predicted phosphodiesterase